MRETRLSGSEGGAGSIPVPTPIEPRQQAGGLRSWKARATWVRGVSERRFPTAVGKARATR